MTSAQLRQRFPKASAEFIRRNADDPEPAPFVPIPPRPKERTNRRNDGRSFQDEIIKTAQAYRALGVLKLEKCDPPVKSFGKKIIRLENTWPDFIGVHTATKRMLAIEAKSTSSHRLSLNNSGGLSVKQVNLLRDWHKAGALAGVLWRFVECEWIGWPQIEAALAAGNKSLKFGGGKPVPQGNGFVRWEFAPVLA